MVALTAGSTSLIWEDDDLTELINVEANLRLGRDRKSRPALSITVGSTSSPRRRLVSPCRGRCSLPPMS